MADNFDMMKMEEPETNFQFFPSCHFFLIVITLCNLLYKVKVKCTLVHVLRICTGRTAHKGSRGIALLFHDHGTRRGERSASRPGRT